MEGKCCSKRRLIIISVIIIALAVLVVVPIVINLTSVPTYKMPQWEWYKLEGYSLFSSEGYNGESLECLGKAAYYGKVYKMPGIDSEEVVCTAMSSTLHTLYCKKGIEELIYKYPARSLEIQYFDNFQGKKIGDKITVKSQEAAGKIRELIVGSGGVEYDHSKHESGDMVYRVGIYLDLNWPIKMDCTIYKNGSVYLIRYFNNAANRNYVNYVSSELFDEIIGAQK